MIQIGLHAFYPYPHYVPPYMAHSFHYLCGFSLVQTELKRLQKKNAAMELELSSPDLGIELPSEIPDEL